MRHLCTLVLMSALVPQQAASQSEAVAAHLERTGSLRHRLLREASGVAASRSYPGTLWTHNDSGHEPEVFAINRAGALLARFRVSGARNNDWEDIDLAPCPSEPGDCLYIADTGDNNRRRNDVDIYVVPEPDPTHGASDSVTSSEPAMRIEVRYPRGRSWDVEALAVDSAGNILLISKGRSRGINLFRVRADGLDEHRVDAEWIRRLPILPLRNLGRWVTGAAVSPSGTRLVVRTYNEMFFFDLAAGILEPEPLACWIGAVEPQGEAVDFLDEHRVILLSESVPNNPGTVFEATCDETSQ